jgi:ABC-2 type transport system ATP-binding protein
MVGLTHAAQRPVGEFSRGMARRIGLAQALINDPDLLILDEPTAGLDPVGCRQIKDLLGALAKRGKTVVLSSHLLADVQDVCDRITLLHNGRSIAAGTLDGLLKHSEKLQFTVETHTPEQVEAIKIAIRECCGEDPSVDVPTIALETFFVNAIANATGAADTPPSGVSQKTALAPFLGEP